MKTTNKEYLDLHLIWRSEIGPKEDIEIDETVFADIYKMQEDENVQSNDSRREISR